MLPAARGTLRPMKIVLKRGTESAAIHHIEQWLMSRGCIVHRLFQPDENLLCAISEGSGVDLDDVRRLPGVAEAERFRTRSSSPAVSSAKKTRVFASVTSRSGAMRSS